MKSCTSCGACAQRDLLSTTANASEYCFPYSTYLGLDSNGLGRLRGAYNAL